MTIQEYIRAIDEQFQTGVAHEHAYRPALQQLLDEMLPDYTVTNEPSRYQCGAPDYLISQSKGAKQPVFFVEAKDLFDSDLDGMRQHKEQFNRYKSSLDYIIFTDYGSQLIDLHLMKNTASWQLTTTFPEAGNCEVTAIHYADDKVYINKEQYFGNVSATAWNAYIGGYQPAQKWLKDRKTRALTFDDIRHYMHIIHALCETERIMTEIG